MRLEKVEITPEMAIEMLATANETPDPLTVARYAEAMRNGTWEFRHRGLVFDTEGRIADGIKRLAALVEANVTLPFMVWTDVDVQQYTLLVGQHNKYPILAPEDQENAENTPLQPEIHT